MTQANRPVTRLTFASVRSQGHTREVAVTINSTWIGLRLKGTRKTFQLDVQAAYQYAAKAEADKIRREKKMAKRGGK